MRVNRGPNKQEKQNMTGLTHDQQRTFEAACQVIDRTRAHEILQLKNWHHGMCGCLNAVKPDGPDVSERENAVILQLWTTLPGWTCWMSALYLLCNQPERQEVAR
jgi:hypothetical protein